MLSDQQKLRDARRVLRSDERVKGMALRGHLLALEAMLIEVAARLIEPLPDDQEAAALAGMIAEVRETALDFAHENGSIDEGTARFAGAHLVDLAARIADRLSELHSPPSQKPSQE